MTTNTAKSEKKSSKSSNQAIDKSLSPLFHCQKCGELICHGYELRTYKKNHHVVISKDVYERLVIGQHKKPFEDPDFAITKKVRFV